METDIQVGDRVTYKYKDENDIKINIITSNNDKAVISQNDKEILKIERPKYEVIEEKKELLTEEEKEYLGVTLKFEKNKTKYIKKIQEVGHIKLMLLFGDGPADGYYRYLKDKYFKNLKFNKFYTLEELGLEE